MTRESRTTIATSDIKAVELECLKCHNRILRPAGAVWQQDIVSCPGCGNSWMPYRDALTKLRDVIFELRALSLYSNQAGPLPFSVRLEIDGDDKP